MTKKIIYGFISIVSLLVIFAHTVFADARSQLILENNCSEPVTFTVQGDDAGHSFNTIIQPHNYYNAGSYINSNTVIHQQSDIKISFVSPNQRGGLDYLLDNGWTSNTANFTNYRGSVEVEHDGYDKSYTYNWHSYAVSTKFRIPSFTVSSCAKKLNIQNSELKSINRILIFGDSVSDDGNLYAYTGYIIPKSTPYYTGMFSNGDPWSVQLTNRLKWNKIPVSNYAVGGATVLFEDEWAKIGLPYDLSDELLAYNHDSAAKQSTNKLAVFFIGANDYLSVSPTMSYYEQLIAVAKVTKEIESSIESVNASQTIIIGLPDLSLSPESHELKNEAVVKRLSTMHNYALERYAQNHSDKVKFISLKPMFDMLFNNTQMFNQMYHTKIDPARLTTSCWTGGYSIPRGEDKKEFYQALLEKNNGIGTQFDINKISLSPDITTAILAGETGQLCNDPEHYAFWDHVHPTYQMHEALYQYILGQLHITSETVL